MSDNSSTLPEVKAAIIQRFLAEWNDISPYRFDNEQYQGDADGWVRLSVRHLYAGQQTLGQQGNRKFYREAAAFLQVFVLPDKGTKLADTLMVAGQALFEGRTIPGTSIRFKDVIPREIGNVEDGRWWGSTIQANFDYIQIK
jgi:hypothetical protein